MSISRQSSQNFISYFGISQPQQFWIIAECHDGIFWSQRKRTHRTTKRTVVGRVSHQTRGISLQTVNANGMTTRGCHVPFFLGFWHHKADGTSRARRWNSPHKSAIELAFGTPKQIHKFKSSTAVASTSPCLPSIEARCCCDHFGAVASSSHHVVLLCPVLEGEVSVVKHGTI